VGNYIIRRLFQVLITAFIIVTLVFIVIRIAPGDPAAVMTGPAGDVYTYESIRSYMGLDRPWHLQYFDYLKSLLVMDLGSSLFYTKPVTELILERIPATLELAFLAVLFTVLIGVPLGIYSSIKSESLLGKIFVFLAYSTQSMAEFWLGIVLVFIFSIKLGIFPSFGRGTVAHIILPSLCITLPLLARVLRFTRTGLLEIMQKDFIRTARSKGLSERNILYGHAFKNILIPLVTDIGLRFGWLLGGMVVVEAVFKWPGMGSLIVQAVTSRDYSVIQGCVLVYSFLFLIVNLLIDITYTFIDPRIKYD